MSLNKILLPLAGTLWLALAAHSQINPVDAPLPLVGTDAHGHAYPGATVPFGMVQLSPDTRTETWDGCSGYHYSDSVIQGFSHTHLSGTGCGGLGDVMLMPGVGDVQWDVGSPGNGYASQFSHAQETASPGYYRVFLATPKVTAELTASERCGFHKYTFPASEQSHIILDLDHGIGNKTLETDLKVENETTVSGYRVSEGWGGRRDIYFVLQFSKPFASVNIEQDGQKTADARAGHGRAVKAVFGYKTAADDAVLVKVGISGTSVEGARRNLAAEISGWDFKAVQAAAAQQWGKIFDSVKVDSFDPHLRMTFYANLYLSCLAPTLFDDVDGTYRGYDHKNHAAANFKNYTTFSIWDIYRAEWPLLTILHPNRINDMVQSMLAEHGELGQHSTSIWPLWGNETWCMIGYHSADMVAEAYLDGFHGFDAEQAYQAIRDTATQDRNGLNTYKHLGYVASKPGAEATSKTLEYTFDDWCIAKMAKSLGHDDDAKLFYQRSANYRNLFDTTTQFFRGRKADGQWRVPFVDNAMVGDEYTEADAWQYAFDVQQNVPDMISLYGGDQGFIQKMDIMFITNSTIITSIPDISGRIGQYSQGDEQSHHVAYLYDYAGVPFKTQKWVRQAMTTQYDDTPAGQCGNVDCGQMAAWYIFSALGFYPVNPASDVFAIGSPIVSKAVVQLDGEKYHGATFTVVAKNNSAENVYIQSAELNGKPLNRAWITRDEVVNGGTLSLVMGSQPNADWGSTDRPPATMPADFQYPNLPTPSSDKLVQLPLPIRVVCGAGDSVDGFVVDPNTVAGGMGHADVSVDTSAPHAAPAAVYQYESYGKDFSYTFPVPTGEKYLVRLHFAEIFDSGAGTRVENIAINGETVLKNFDIFAEAGKNKAVVKEFPDVSPDAKGNIVIRISATPDSPDQNAKISGIEITAKEAGVSSSGTGNAKVTAECNGGGEATPSFIFKTVPRPATNDIATSATFAIVDGEADSNSGELEKLHDGKLPSEADQPDENFFFQAGSDGGRLSVDLKSVTDIRQVNTYSCHPTTRCPQVYKLYAADGTAPGFNAAPKRGTAPEQCGWKLIASVNTVSQSEAGGQCGVSIAVPNATLGKFRYLLFDISPSEHDDAFGNTFFSEIDVVDASAPVTALNGVDAAASNDFSFKTADGKCTIELITKDAPELKDWAEQQLAPVLAKWYPKISTLLASDGYSAPDHFKMTLKPMNGVAYTAGRNVVGNSIWLDGELQKPGGGEALGSLVHELVHVVQQFHGNNPGWLVEGSADYVRWFQYDAAMHGADIVWFRKHGKNFSPHYNDSYRITANFLNWVSEKYDKDIVSKMNAAMRENNYSEDLWKKYTGKTVVELGEEWKQSVTAQMAPATASNDK